MGSPRVIRVRRGANAVEFALIMPLLVTLLGGVVDYGWFFWREALATNALREGVRAGSLKAPLSGETGMTCSPCLAAANTAANASLAAQGFASIGNVATLERLPSTGTPCTYAIVLQPTIVHARIMPLIPGPESYNIRVLSMAQAVPCS